jgi:predicted dehydrogenase
MAEAALSEGKHVLSEKPTAMNAGEAERMLAVAREHPGQLALIDHELRFLPAWIEAKRLLGDLGPIRFIEMRYCSGSRADRNRAWNWWSDAKRGGGVLGAIGSHLVDAVRYLAGEIESVQATLSTFVSERPDGEAWRTVTSDDFAALHCRLSSGATAAITASVVATSDEPTTITIHATHGGIRLVDESLLLARPGKPFELAHGESLANRPGNSSGGAFGSGTLHLGHALRRALDEGDRSALAPAASFEDGLAQQRILDAARRSAGSGTLTPVER